MLALAATALTVGVVSVVVILWRPSSSSQATNSSAGGLGTVTHIVVPAALRRLRLTNQHGQRVNLASWPGKTLLLVPFLSLCQDTCPLTTGNLLRVQQSLRADHATSQVQIVELTVDPGRDTPAQTRRLQKFFGLYYQRVPEEKPAELDWWTHKALTYDMDHSNDYFVIDRAGTERVVNDAAPDFHGRLSPTLYKFLSQLGRQHLKGTPQPNWTPADALQALGLVLRRSLPASAS
jgi:protein SCO1/2